MNKCFRIIWTYQRRGARRILIALCTNQCLV
jgi:hypothetical protein